MTRGWTFIVDGKPVDVTLRPALLDNRPTKKIRRPVAPPKTNIGFRPAK